MMQTVFAIGFLILCGIVANFVAVLALNIAGVPGAMAAGRPGHRSKRRFILGSMIASVGQSYLYLAFTGFVVSWTRLAAARDDVAAVAVWPVAFLTVALPIWITLIRARLEARESEHANPQLEALHLTVLLVLAGFVVFAFAPIAMRVLWPWVPYVD